MKTATQTPYISRITGDLVVEETVSERRQRDAVWMRRHKRSLGRNKQFRACVRMDHELRKEMEKLKKEAEAAQASSAAIARRVNDFLQSVPRIFTRRSAK